MNVAELLLSQATLRPDAPALIERSGHRHQQISFAQLDANSARGASLLAASGIGAGDHVLVFVPMSIDLYLALIAIFRNGAVATFLDPSVGSDHIRRCCEMVRPTAMIAIPKAHLLRLTSSALRQIPRKFSVGGWVPGARSWDSRTPPLSSTAIVPRQPNDPALVTFTSGSTGNPKAAVRSHGFLAAQHASLQRAINLTPGEVDLATLPIFSLANLASGVTSVIADADLRRPGQIDPAPVLRQIAEHRVTRSVASPALFERILDAPNSSASLGTMRHIQTGGAPVFPRLMDRLQRAMPAAQIVAVYGSTEAEPIAHIAREEIAVDDLQAMLGGAGLLAGAPVPDIDLRIIPNRFGQPLAPMCGAEFAGRILPANAPGEIVVHGRHVLRGYLNGVGNELTKFRVDEQIWHRTGDAGYLDPRGRLWLLGRAEARIQDEHGEIYPFAVECAASQLDEVVRSALIQHRGKRTLVVETTNQMRNGNARRSVIPSETRVLGLNQILSWAKLDGNFVFLDRIPVDKRHNAKIDYPALRKLLG